MKKITKEQGFTLIELLAIIVIIGIISATIIISMTSVYKKNRTNYYNSQERMIKLSAKNYMSDKPDFFPKKVGQIKVIYLNQLKNENYISKIVDYKKKDCNLETSYIRVNKTKNNNYDYYLYLECPDYNPSENKTKKANIDINFTDDLLTYIYPVISVKLSDNKKIGIASYEYRVESNGKDYYNSRNTKNKEKDKTKDINFKVNFNKLSLKPGTYTLTVIAYDIYGNSFMKKKNVTINKPKAECGQVTVKDNNNIQQDKTYTSDFENMPWLKGSRIVNIKCIGNSCTNDSISTIYNENMTVNKVTIDLSLKDGTKLQCPVTVKLDNTPPTEPNVTYWKKDNLTILPYNSEWTNKDISIVAEGSVDKHSGGVYYEYFESDKVDSLDDSMLQTKFKEKTSEKLITEEGMMKSGFRACDKVGNCTNIKTKDIKIDKTAPTLPTINTYVYKDNNVTPTKQTLTTTTLSYTPNTWTNKSIYTISSNSTDNLSGLDYYETINSKTNERKKTDELSYIETGKYIASYRACDKAGNCSKYKTIYNLNIDKEPPKCTTSATIAGSSNKYTFGTWTNKTVELHGNCNDTGGSGCLQNINKTVSEETNKKYSPGVVKDNAGNTKECPNEIIKIDTTPPTCKKIDFLDNGYIGNIDEKTKNPWYIKGTDAKNPAKAKTVCSDNAGGSGCEKEFYITTESKEGKHPKTVTIKDKAGNSMNCNFHLNIDTEPPYITNGSSTNSHDTYVLYPNVKDTSTNGQKAVNEVCKQKPTFAPNNEFTWAFRFRTTDKNSGYAEMILTKTETDITKENPTKSEPINIKIGYDKNSADKFYDQTICNVFNRVDITSIKLTDLAGNSVTYKNPNAYLGKPDSQTLQNIQFDKF